MRFGSYAPVSKTKIHFGTDGWRGVIAADFTFENVRRVAQATADYWNTQPDPKQTIVGYDTRFLSETYARLVCEVMAANGIATRCASTDVPTPALAYAVRNQQLCGAVMITASHNPPQFNGYKLKARFAGSATPAICAAIEARVDAAPVRSVPFETTVPLCDPRPAHIAALKKLVDLRAIHRAKLRVVFDSMHGCGGRILQDLAGGTTIREGRDVLFGGVNPEPTQKNLAALMGAVQDHQAAIGLATDGDADRLGVVDESGRYVSIQLVLAALLLHVVRNRKERQGIVVKSGNCTVLMDRICQASGLECVTVPVGFKWICQQMRERDVIFGGEESGGVGFRGHIPERDGILANLMLLELLATTGTRLSRLLTELQAEFGRSVYDRIDLPFPLDLRQSLIERLAHQPPAQLAGVPLREIQTTDGIKYIATDDSWLMFRASGTEPLIRIYSEAATRTKVRQLLELGTQLARTQ